MRLGDQIRRWWSPAEWPDEHPQVSDGETLTEEQQAELHEMQYHDHAAHTRFRGRALPSERDEEGEPEDD